ncbi:MAG TPA: DUF1287 domain-containing protein [Povalibacter sp.]
MARLIAMVVATLWLVSAHADDIAAAARSQVGVTLRYDPAYREIPFPNGDVPIDRGVCTDVVVRALRDARQIDLQREVNADMTANRDAYPHKWSRFRSKPDPNIDHRRVPNLMTYFARRGYAVPISRDPGGYSAGDIVAWNLGGDVLHIGVVSDRSVEGRPLIVHNIGSGAKEEDVLLRFKLVIGHYRLPAAPNKPPQTAALTTAARAR